MVATPTPGEPLRIGMVCYPSVGGSGIVATELGMGLYCRGHHVHFISYDLPERLIVGEDGGFLVEQCCQKDNNGSLRFHHIDVPSYPLFRFPPYTLALATCLYRLVQEEDLDLVHVHYAIPHSTSALLAKSMLAANSCKEVKIITTLHGTDSVLVGQEPNYRETVEFSINGSDAVTVVSESLRQQTAAMFNLHTDMHVIHNMIDHTIFRPPADEARAARDNAPLTLMHISNFRPVKRIADLIQAFDMICRAVDCRLVLVGDGPDRRAAEELAAQRGVADRVEFLGKRHDVPDLLRQADLLLCTSANESFGMSVAEAMSTGVPVVAYRVGGIPEVMADGETGYLVKPHDVAQLAEASVRILRCAVLRERMRSAARRRIEQHFAPDRILPRYETLYHQLLQK